MILEFLKYTLTVFLLLALAWAAGCVVFAVKYHLNNDRYQLVLMEYTAQNDWIVVKRFRCVKVASVFLLIDMFSDFRLAYPPDDNEDESLVMLELTSKYALATPFKGILKQALQQKYEEK